jgi:hypothetical protein
VSGLKNKAHMRYGLSFPPFAYSLDFNPVNPSQYDFAFDLLVRIQDRFSHQV